MKKHWMFIEVNLDFRDNFHSLAGPSGLEKNQVPVVYCQIFLLYVISGLSLSKTFLPFPLKYLESTSIILILLLTLWFPGQMIRPSSPRAIPSYVSTYPRTTFLDLTSLHSALVSFFVNQFHATISHTATSGKLLVKFYKTAFLQITPCASPCVAVASKAVPCTNA